MKDMHQWRIKCVQRTLYRLSATAEGGGLVGLVPVVLGVVAGTVSVLLVHGAVVHAGTGLGHEGDSHGGAALEGVRERGEEEGTVGVNVIVEGEEGLAGDLIWKRQRIMRREGDKNLVLCNWRGCDAWKCLRCSAIDWFGVTHVSAGGNTGTLRGEGVDNLGAGNGGGSGGNDGGGETHGGWLVVIEVGWWGRLRGCVGETRKKKKKRRWSLALYTIFCTHE